MEVSLVQPWKARIKADWLRSCQEVIELGDEIKPHVLWFDSMWESCQNLQWFWEISWSIQPDHDKPKFLLLRSAVQNSSLCPGITDRLIFHRAHHSACLETESTVVIIECLAWKKHHIEWRKFFPPTVSDTCDKARSATRKRGGQIQQGICVWLTVDAVSHKWEYECLLRQSVAQGKCELIAKINSWHHCAARLRLHNVNQQTRPQSHRMSVSWLTKLSQIRRAYSALTPSWKEL